MATEEYLYMLRQGVDTWNKWRHENLGEHLQLCEIDLRGSNLRGIDLRRTDLSRANLSEANLSNARLWKASLGKADLSRACLRDTYLYKAWLTQANLHRADCEGATFARAYLHKAIFRNADLSVTNFNGADLSDADLTSASFVSTNLMRANLTGCSIFGISAWNVQLKDTIQSNLIIDDGKTTITIDNFEVAQFIYLLLEHRKLRDTLNSVIEKGVLILGRFDDDGLKLLHAIAAKLREMKYLPILFDFARPESRDLTETVMILAGLSRFVIANLSGSSVPQELYATIPHFKIPFVPLIEEERRAHSMFRDLLGYPWVLQPVEFTSQEHLMEILKSKVIQPAEEKFQERQILLDGLFNR